MPASAAIGKPFASALPNVDKSGVTPLIPWYPPRPARKPVFTSSKMSTNPAASASSRRPSKYPGRGFTTPMFCSTGSVIRAATCISLCERSHRFEVVEFDRVQHSPLAFGNAGRDRNERILVAHDLLAAELLDGVHQVGGHDILVAVVAALHEDHVVAASQARATRIACAVASEPVLKNCTLSAPGTHRRNSRASSPSSSVGPLP